MRFRHYFCGPFEINRIPQSDGRDKQIQTAGPVALVLEGAVPDFPEPVEAYSSRQGIVGFSLVESSCHPPSKGRVSEPLQHE